MQAGTCLFLTDCALLRMSSQTPYHYSVPVCSMVYHTGWGGGLINGGSGLHALALNPDHCELMAQEKSQSRSARRMSNFPRVSTSTSGSLTLDHTPRVSLCNQKLHTTTSKPPSPSPLPLLPPPPPPLAP